MTKLEKDIAFCIDELNASDEDIGDMLRACEKLGGITVEYFCEEFIFGIWDENGNEDLETLTRLHDEEYLNIAEFNALYWEQ